MRSHRAADTCSNIRARHLSAAHDAENPETATAAVFAVIKRLPSSVDPLRATRSDTCLWSSSSLRSGQVNSLHRCMTTSAIFSAVSKWSCCFTSLCVRLSLTDLWFHFLKLWSRSLNASPEPHRFVSPAKLTRAALPPPAGHFQPYAEQLFKADTGSDEISSVLWCVLSVLDFFKAFYRPENIISVP